MILFPFLTLNIWVSFPRLQFSSIQPLSCVQLFATPWTAACQASLELSWSLLKLMSLESVMPSNHLISCCPLLPPSIFPSIRVFSNDSVLRIRWPKYWSFNLDISPSNEYSGLISFRMDWLDLLAVQGTLFKSSFFQSFPGGSAGKESTCNAGYLGKQTSMGSQIRSDQISRSVVSDSFRPHE